ncbi:hypothetical protein C7999DRAFT_18234 [Corynascus novoguineensis]|uniref:2-amino-3-carboxymuconate-6-semialdehyde decarboxylase n=1 Tax=Corynascus novoguineensis TaxID=1126955 RepID=A0AAN7HIN9_9PEZI|nr:hypothetical protein C7999DRAFT_18234 [Corynascus novoguineensis]
MAPSATSSIFQPCCSHEDRPRDPSSPSSLFRIDMHTHIMPPRLPNLTSDDDDDEYAGDHDTNSRDRPQSQPIPYTWPTFRPAPDHAATGAVDMYVDGAFFRRVDRSCYDAEARVREMDAAGVDVQVLSTVPALFCYDAPATAMSGAVRLARALNDHVADVCAARPDRFVGLGTVPLQDCGAAVAELRRLMRMPGMVGVQIGTSVEQRFGAGVMMLDDERLEGFWRACEELDAAVFVHPLGYALTRENKGRWGRYWGSWLVGMPCETALAMHAVTSSGLLVRHPRLRLCFAHGGGAFPALLGRIQHGFDCRPDLVATKACGVTPTEHFRGEAPGSSLSSPNGSTAQPQLLGQIWIDSLMHDPDLMEYVLRKLGPDGTSRIVLGSDYPFPLGEVPVAGKMLTEDERLGRFMTWRERAKILAENAIRFLNLGPEFEKRFEDRWRGFESARQLPAGELSKDGSWEGWRHRDSAIDLDGEEHLDGNGDKKKFSSRDLDRSPRSVSAGSL